MIEYGYINWDILSQYIDIYSQGYIWKTMEWWALEDNDNLLNILNILLIGQKNVNNEDIKTAGAAQAQ